MKIYTNKLKESWIIDRVNEEWNLQNSDLITHKVKESDIVWIIANWVWKKVPKKYLQNKKVVVSVYHIDFDSFDKEEEKDFYELDQYVHTYHVISQKTKEQLKKLTDKEIISIPFWINQENYFYIDGKKELREKLGFSTSDFLVGSFQRDTEGHDLKSPKLIKGPDIFLNIVSDMSKSNENLKVVLSGTRRQYLINELNKIHVEYKYFEMADLHLLNNLYNVLDLYLVTSRLEGGPQAILESAITKTPIISTDVGVASEILHQDSIFEPEFYQNAKPNTEYAFQKSGEYIIPEGMKKFRAMFSKIYEN
jgi:glycosyltransferase involved in cell wall biosynthesis